MKVLVAAKVGNEIGEMFYGVEGELVRPSLPCSDRLCECGKSFTGLASGQFCTYAQVADLAHIGNAPFRAAWFDALVREEGLERTAADHRWAMEWAERVLSAADVLETGTIVSYDGASIRSVVTR